MQVKALPVEISMVRLCNHVHTAIADGVLYTVDVETAWILETWVCHLISTAWVAVPDTLPEG